MRCPTLTELPPPPAGKTGWPWTEEPPHLPDRMPNGSAWPRISIVTPSYNQGKFIEESIRSVLMQGYPSLEFIIIDGGSTDRSVEVIKRYEQWIAFWVSEKDRGQAHAINKGFSQAAGDIFAWLNSDDCYLPDCLRSVAFSATKNPLFSWFVGTTLRVDVNLKIIDRLSMVESYEDWLDFYFTKKSGVTIPQPSCFWTKVAWNKTGKLNESLRFVMDYEYWGRLAKGNFRPFSIANELAIFRLQPDSKTQKGREHFWKEELQVVGDLLQILDKNDYVRCKEYQKYLGKRIGNLNKVSWLRKIK